MKEQFALFKNGLCSFLNFLDLKMYNYLFIKKEERANHSFQKGKESESLSLLFTKKAKKANRSLKKSESAICSFLSKKRAIRTKNQRGNSHPWFNEAAHLQIMHIVTITHRIINDRIEKSVKGRRIRHSTDHPE